MNSAGKVMMPAAREMVTRPASSGWRRVSPTALRRPTFVVISCRCGGVARLERSRRLCCRAFLRMHTPTESGQREADGAVCSWARVLSHPDWDDAFAESAANYYYDACTWW